MGTSCPAATMTGGENYPGDGSEAWLTFSLVEGKYEVNIKVEGGANRKQSHLCKHSPLHVTPHSTVN